MRNKSAFFAGILAGIASPATIFANSNYPPLRGSDIERMRGDVERVGNNFATVIEREHAKTKNATSKQST